MSDADPQLGQPASVDLSQNYMATCPKGVEHVLAKELIALGAEQVVESVAACYFVANQELAYKICCWTRIANRILLLLERQQIHSLDEFRQRAMDIDWPAWFSPERSIAVDFNGSNFFIRDSRFGAQVTKDAINEVFQSRGHDRLVVDTVAPDVLVYVRLFKARLSIGLDLVGESLHKRGYRRATGEAPLKENLAAAILYLAEWPALSAQGLPFVDPMCGSGTLLIEAALIACGVAPTWLRHSWLLQNLANYDEILWKQQREQVAESCKKLEANAADSAAVIRGFDSDRKVVALARDNVRSAGLEAVISIQEQPIDQLAVSKDSKPDNWEQFESGLVVVNPPYGKRLGEVESLGGLYHQLGEWLKRDCLGWLAAVFTGNPELGWSTGLRSWRQHALFNGSIACQLQRYRIEEKNFSAGRAPGTGIASEDELNDSATMLANRIRKNQRKLKKWLKANTNTCYRIYDADLPEYAAAIDCYPIWPLTNKESTESEVISGSPNRYFHVQEYARPSQN